jgi:hypothetical protein
VCGHRILLWAVLLRLEAINWEIMAICTLVSGGVRYQHDVSTPISAQ